MNYGLMDNFIADLTEERLKAAEEKLRSMFPESAYVQEDNKKICLDKVTGICYLRMFIEGEAYYINITN